MSRPERSCDWEWRESLWTSGEWMEAEDRVRMDKVTGEGQES